MGSAAGFLLFVMAAGALYDWKVSHFFLVVCLH